MVPEKLGLLRSGLRFLVKSAVWLRSGLRFQVKGAVYTVWIFICICMSLRPIRLRRDSYFPGLPLALLFYARALIGRTDGA